MVLFLRTIFLLLALLLVFFIINFLIKKIKSFLGINDDDDFDDDDYNNINEDKDF